MGKKDSADHTGEAQKSEAEKAVEEYKRLHGDQAPKGKHTDPSGYRTSGR